MTLGRSTCLAAVVGVSAVALAAQPAAAENSDIELPSSLSWTAYGVGSGGYNMAAAVGSALQEQLGVNLRVVPGGNDIARQAPVREGRVQFSAQGLAAYFSQEGVFEFADPDWGPQPSRALIMAHAPDNLTIGVAADAGIERLEDLEGKRVAYVVAAPALNVNIEVLLACAGLTWDDVERVDFPGFGESWRGLIEGEVDAAWATQTSGMAYEAEASPRGLHWPPVPHDDDECWTTIGERGPWFYQQTGTEGAAVSPDAPHEGAAYPYPILMAYEEQDADLVYNMTRAMVETYEHYKDGAPGNTGWALDRQIFDWVIPYHEGAIQYFEEQGVWTEEHQAHNDRLLERQRVLKEAWEQVMDMGLDGDEFEEAWLETRREALEEAGFDPVL